MSGILGPKVQREMMIAFSPRSDAHVNCTAICTVTGTLKPLKLQICGSGKGPDVKFSFTRLDAGKILVKRPQAFELVMHNRSEIEAAFSTQMKSEYLHVSPCEGIVNSNGYQIVLITIRSTRLGVFEEKIRFEFVGCSKIHSVTIRFEQRFGLE